MYSFMFLPIFGAEMLRNNQSFYQNLDEFLLVVQFHLIFSLAVVKMYFHEFLLSKNSH